MPKEAKFDKEELLKAGKRARELISGWPRWKRAVAQAISEASAEVDEQIEDEK